MEAERLNGLLRHLHRSIDRAEDAAADAELLTRFVEAHDREAFAALARRHGRMVWGVCRRLLGEDHAAEDAFQATFLVLARKAAAVRPRSMLANWLYGVAHRTALEARRAAAMRRAKERRAAAMAERAYTTDDPSEDLRVLLDQELASLPDKYRAPVVLCDLEGLTRKEAARRLGWSEGTLSGRLFRARALLAGRLAGRGLTVCGGALAGLLPEAGAAGPPASLITSMIQSVLPVIAGQVAMTSAGAVALAEGVLKAMLLTKLKMVATGLMVACLALTAGSVGYRAQATEPAADPAAPKGAAPTRKDSDVIQQRRDRLQIEQELVARLKQEVAEAQAEAKELKLELIDAHKQLLSAQNRLAQAQGETEKLQKEATEGRAALQRAVGDSAASDKEKDQLKRELDAARAKAEQLQQAFVALQNQLNFTQQQLMQVQAEKEKLRKEAEARGALPGASGQPAASDKDKDQLKKLLAERDEAAAQAAQAAAQAAQAQARLRQLDEMITERWPDRKGPPSSPPATSQPAKSAELTLRAYQIEELIADGRGGEASRASADVISVITQMVAPESWTTQGGPGTIACFGKTRTLFVNQTKEVHAEVTKMLDELRARAVHQQREAEESMRRETERVKQLPRTPKKE
jgi:RNA polymerase sigma factor (sigma-70 family)